MIMQMNVVESKNIDGGRVVDLTEWTTARSGIELHNKRQHCRFQLLVLHGLGKLPIFYGFLFFSCLVVAGIIIE